MNTQYNPDGDIRVHLLLVDDDINLLETMSHLLAQKGYIVTPATGSSYAITILKNKCKEFDVVVTDLCMPGINGLELAGMIREVSLDIPVILHSGKIDIINERQAAKAGIAETITKPYRVEDLDELIKKVIKGNRHYKVHPVNE